jgi:protoporphyrinogen IX oxidase
MSGPVMRAVAGMGAFAALALALLWLDPVNFYPWLKALHVVAVMSWMAGMLYLPRLFVYHADAEIGSVQSETFKVMERRLLRAIINPAMIVTWVTGLWLAWRGFQLMGGWLHMKIFMVIMLSAAHGYFSASVRRFAQNKNQRPARHWRAMNEVPTALMIGIVIMVVVKPF